MVEPNANRRPDARPAAALTPTPSKRLAAAASAVASRQAKEAPQREALRIDPQPLQPAASDAASTWDTTRAQESWVTGLQYATAPIVAFLLAVIFIQAHTAIDQEVPAQAEAQSYYVTVIVLGLGSVVGWAFLATRSEWRAAPLGLLGLGLVPWLASLSARVGGAACGYFMEHRHTCNPEALVGTPIFWSVAGLVMLTTLAGALLHVGLGQGRWGPALAMAGGIAVTLALVGASALALGALSDTAARAAVANRAHNIPGAGSWGTLAVLAGAAALVRRRRTGA